MDSRRPPVQDARDFFCSCAEPLLGTASKCSYAIPFQSAMQRELRGRANAGKVGRDELNAQKQTCLLEK